MNTTYIFGDQDSKDQSFITWYIIIFHSFQMQQNSSLQREEFCNEEALKWGINEKPEITSISVQVPS